MSKSKGKADEDNDEEEEVKPAADDEQPSTSGLQADNNGEAQGAERTVKRASRKQVINMFLDGFKITNQVSCCCLHIHLLHVFIIF